LELIEKIRSGHISEVLVLGGNLRNSQFEKYQAEIPRICPGNKTFTSFAASSLSLSLIGKYPPTLVSSLIYCPLTAPFHHVTDISTVLNHEQYNLKSPAGQGQTFSKIRPTARLAILASL
jgi:hypothetical protein